MKKLIAALMAVAILLSLCACGSTSTPKKKNIDDITSEDLEAAAERLMEGEEETAPAQSVDDIEKAFQKSREPYVSKLEGLWIKISNSSFTDRKYSPEDIDIHNKLTIDSNFIALGNTKQTWLVTNGKILSGNITGTNSLSDVLEFEIITVNGFEMLRQNYLNESIWYVRAAQMEELYDAMVYDVTLTNDNVKDNFELRQIYQEQIDSFGDKTGKYKDTIYLCNKLYDDGFICMKYNDVLIEVIVPHYNYIQNPYYSGMKAFTLNFNTPDCHDITPVSQNIFGYDEKADISTDDITIGRAKGDIKYLRPAFVDHIDGSDAYDVFGNHYFFSSNSIPSETFN